MRLRGAVVPHRFYLNLLRSSDVLKGSLRAAGRRRLTAQLDYRFRNGYSSPPVQFDLKLTNACNLRCKMCGQWGETGWHIDQPFSFVRETVSLDTYKKMVDDVASWWPWMFIYGGEPMLYRDFLPLTAYMKEKGLLVSVVTNGTLLPKMGAEIVAQGLDFVMVSIDGPRDVHDEIRGMQGSYDRAVAGLETVHEHRRQRGVPTPFTMIIATVCKSNTGSLLQVFELAQRLQVDAVIGYFGYFQTDDSCRKHELVMKEKLDTIAISQRGWRWDVTSIDTAELIKTLRTIRSRRWNFAYVFAPELSDEDIPNFYSDFSATFGYNRCVAPWMMAAILPNGDVAPCRDYPDYVVGNICVDSLVNMWNSDRLRRFRTVLKEETLLPVCHRCCGLMDI